MPPDRRPAWLLNTNDGSGSAERSAAAPSGFRSLQGGNERTNAKSSGRDKDYGDAGGEEKTESRGAGNLCHRVCVCDGGRNQQLNMVHNHALLVQPSNNARRPTRTASNHRGALSPRPSSTRAR